MGLKVKSFVVGEQVHRSLLAFKTKRIMYFDGSILMAV